MFKKQFIFSIALAFASNLNCMELDKQIQTSSNKKFNQSVEHCVKEYQDLELKLKKLNMMAAMELREASLKGELQAVRLLLKLNITNVDAANIDGETALMKAAESGYYKIAAFLITKGADVNAKSKFDATPLIYAVWKGHKDIVLLLLEKNADINAKNWCGNHVLQIAVECNHKEIVAMLLSRLFTNLKAIREALELARKKNIIEIVKIIENFFNSGLFAKTSELLEDMPKKLQKLEK